MSLIDKTRWVELAKARPELRYPVIATRASTCRHYSCWERFEVNILFETFVDNGEGRLMHITDSYSIEDTNWDGFLQARKYFQHKCEITIEKAIFNEDTSIKEIEQ